MPYLITIILLTALALPILAVYAIGKAVADDHH